MIHNYITKLYYSIPATFWETTELQTAETSQSIKVSMNLHLNTEAKCILNKIVMPG